MSHDRRSAPIFPLDPRWQQVFLDTLRQPDALARHLQSLAWLAPSWCGWALVVPGGPEFGVVRASKYPRHDLQPFDQIADQVMGAVQELASTADGAAWPLMVKQRIAYVEARFVDLVLANVPLAIRDVVADFASAPAGIIVPNAVQRCLISAFSEIYFLAFDHLLAVGRVSPGLHRRFLGFAHADETSYNECLRPEEIALSSVTSKSQHQRDSGRRDRERFEFVDHDMDWVDFIVKGPGEILSNEALRSRLVVIGRVLVDGQRRLSRRPA